MNAIVIKEKHLKRKGWQAHEIEHAKHIYHHARKIKKKEHHILDELGYWVGLTIAMASTLAVALWIIPLLVLAKTSIVYLFLAIIALSFGVLYNHAIKDLDHLDKHHHILYTASLPLASIASFWAVTQQTNTMGGVVHNGAVAGAVFGILLMLPYLHRVMKK